MSEEEKQVYTLLETRKEADIDEIYLISGLTLSKVAAILLKLEFSGLVKCLPGKRYRIG